MDWTGPVPIWGSGTPGFWSQVLWDHVGLILWWHVGGWRKFKPAVDSQPSLASPPHLDPGGGGELTHLDSGHQTLVVELTDSFTLEHLLTQSPAAYE